MAQEYVRSLDDQRAKLQTVGGKGASLITLAVLTVLLCGLAGYETVTSREFRRVLRAR
jgi:hypothetical protein